MLGTGGTHIVPCQAQVDDLPVCVRPIQRKEVPLRIGEILKVPYADG
jgi:hypothetical protein